MVYKAIKYVIIEDVYPVDNGIKLDENSVFVFDKYSEAIKYMSILVDSVRNIYETIYRNCRVDDKINSVTIWDGESILYEAHIRSATAIAI